MVRVVGAILITLALLMVASAAFAYRLIGIPTAEALPDGVYKFELAAPHADALDEWLPTYRFDAAIYPGVDISVKGSGAPGEWRSGSTLVGLTWTVAREKGNTPGYGIGVSNLWDSDNHDNVKASMFVGAFKCVKVPGMKYPWKAHLLVGTKQLNGVFGGVAIPFSKRFSGAIEYTPKGTSDTKSLLLPGQTNEIVWALGYNQTEHWRLKYANVGGDDAFGIVYTNKWSYGCKSTF